MLKIAHISDLHLWKIYYGLSQFFSKRWLGNINLIFFRKKRFCSEQLWLLPEIFKKLKIDYVFVSGDISSTSLVDEFLLGKKLFDELKKRGIKTLFVPGNHDSYTKSAYINKTFYQYFENTKGKSDIEKKYSLKKDGVEAHFLENKWWYIGLDCCLATHLASSRGFFSPKIEKNLKNLLKMIPNHDFVILVNHFPFLMTKSPRKALKRANILKKLLKNHPNIKLFLHGHTHHHNIYDLRKKSLPIVLDSGSAAHNSIGKWNLIHLKKKSCEISIYDWIKKDHRWKKTEDKTFHL